MKNTVRRADVRRLALKVDMPTIISVRSAVTLWGDAWFLKHERYMHEQGWENAHLRAALADEFVIRECNALARISCPGSLLARASFGMTREEIRELIAS